MNYYPFHIGDYASATRHLSWDEDCAYRRLLDAYYTAEKPLPADARAVCRLTLATTEAQREAVMTVLEEFWELTEAGWINRRADQEIEAMRAKQQKQRDKANKRWQMPRADSGNALAMPRHEQSDAVASEVDADAMPPTPTPTPTPTPYSVTNVTGASAPPDERDVIWSQGVRLLVAAGKTEGQARSFLGGQVKARGSPAVAQAVTQALIDRPVEPVAYIAGVANDGRNSNRSGRDSSPAQQRSAVGRVRANAARELAAAQSRGAPVDVDDRDVRPPLDICIR